MRWKKRYKELLDKHAILRSKYYYVIEQKAKLEKELDKRNAEYKALWDKKITISKK